MKLISLTKGQFAMVSDHQYETVMAAGPWHAHEIKPGQFYAQRSLGGNKYEKMEHFILGVSNTLVDHIDRNGLNNQDDNFRLATLGQNAQNHDIRSDSKSKLKGVNWDKERLKWRVRIDSKVIGRFPTSIEAAMAYDEAAIKIYGEGAATNKKLGLI